MDKIHFFNILEQPETIQPIQTREIKSVIDEFPYFQSARAIYLKALKKLQSFRYNHELKKTASYTKDRTILFDFITSKQFIEENELEKNKIFEKKNVEEIVEDNIQSVVEEDVTIEVQQAEEKLAIGKPLLFQKNERHSFSQWLQLSGNQKTIERGYKTEQEDIIDNFITNNPKISKLDKSKPLEVVVKSNQEYPQLMTETLAKIYLEQKKYDSAIKAYEILSLKYPEKSGFFADQIKQIQILQK